MHKSINLSKGRITIKKSTNCALSALNMISRYFETKQLIQLVTSNSSHGTNMTKVFLKAYSYLLQVIPNFDVLIISDTLNLPREISLTKSRIFHPAKEDFIAATYRVCFQSLE